MTSTTLHDESRFETLGYLQKRLAQVRRRDGFNAKSPAQLRQWQHKVRAILRQNMGMQTMRRAPLRPKITEQRRFQGYLRQRVEIQTEPDIFMPLYVLIPDGKPPFPVVIAPHGHGSHGKDAVVGNIVASWHRASVKSHHYSYGVEFARAGFLTFCPDARGFGERAEKQERTTSRDTCSCRRLLMQALPLGQTVAGMWTWDLHRLIDYIETRKDADPRRIGCAGLSGGGLQTLYASALDERVSAAATSGYFFGVKESLLDTLHCPCNYIPHLYEHVDMGDIAALIAPRPLLVETGDHDPLNGPSGLKNVTSQTAITRKAYRLLGKSKNLRHAIFPGPHRWNGAAIPFFRTHLL
jgi:dienelactone hydrolase